MARRKHFKAELFPLRSHLARSICIAVLAIVCLAAAQAQPAGRYRDALNELLQNAEFGPRFNGLLLVGDNDRVLFNQAQGFANFELQVPLVRSHKFRIASLSKQFTGLLAILMAEKGVIDLDTSIERYHPALQGTAAGKITLHQILSHTSGLPNDRAYLWDHVSFEYRWDWRKNLVLDSFSGEEFIRQIAKEKHVFSPGSGFSYSNEGYVLAGLTLESAANEPFEALLVKHILSPLGMNDTGVERIDSLVIGKAYNYEWKAGTPFPITRFRNLAAIGPAGGMYSTAGDLHKWAKAVFYESSKALTTTSRKRLLPETGNYSYGLMSSRFNITADSEIDLSFGRKPVDNANTEIIWHNGQVAGTFAFIGFLPGRKVHFIVLSNVGFTFSQQQFVSRVIKALEGSEVRIGDSRRSENR